MPEEAIQYVAKTTPDLTRQQVERLEQIFPECVSEGKVDFDLLRATLGDADALAGDQAYTFTWAGKQDAFQAIQVPSAASLAPAPEESANWDTTRHLFIEGENLEVLKLLYKSYFGRVKMIYIDPPYNTGNDFIYRDDYSEPRRAYLEKTGQVDAEGNVLTSNPETSGRYHSDWLTMMYPRLFLARQLLREDGIMFLSIDDNEVHNLRLMMNEIFGEENFVAQIVWKKVYGGGPKVKYVVDQHEYVLCYTRSIESLGILELPPDPEARKRYTEKDEKYATRGPYFTQPLATTSMDFRPNLRFPIEWEGEEIWPEKQWQWSKERVEEALANNELVFNKQADGTWSVRYKQYLRDENGKERPSKPYSILIGPYTQEGTSEIRNLLGNGKIFPFPKPSELIKHFVSYTWADEEAIILDFFAGSSPTAQAVLEFNREHEGNRQFIMVQFPEPTAEESPARQEGFETIADIGKERIRRVIARMQEGDENGQLSLDLHPDEDMGFKVFKLAPSTFRRWEPPAGETARALGQQLSLFDRGLEAGADPIHVIYEVILKLGYSLNACIEPLDLESNRVYRVTDEEVGASEPSRFYVCLDDELQDATIDALPLDKEITFVCLDTALDDSRKVNLAMQCLLKVI
jgi:adenine-specific DNA-methyltransferase